MNLFENINDKNILKLKQILKANTTFYPKGIDIVSNLSRDDFIGIVDQGSLKIIFNDYNGNSTIIEELNEGDVFGSYTISLEKEEISCITKENTKITYIEYNQITNDEISRTDYYITFVKNLVKLLSEQIKNKNERIDLLTKRTIRDKLLEYFRYLNNNKKNKSFTIPMSFTELASFLAIDRSAMQRELKYLKQEGFISTNGRRVTLLY